MKLKCLKIYILEMSPYLKIKNKKVQPFKSLKQSNIFKKYLISLWIKVFLY